MPHLDKEPQHFIKSAKDKSIHRHSKKYVQGGKGATAHAYYERKSREARSEAITKKMGDKNANSYKGSEING